jgi:23S rRNA pseudouridine2604 synthase
MKEKEATRINKYLSEIGYCSRRVADKLIEEKRVFVNGVIPEMGTKVSDSDEIVVDGVRIQKTDITVSFRLDLIRTNYHLCKSIYQ